MVDESIEKRRRVSQTAVVVPLVTGIVLQVAALVVETPESKALHRSLQVASLVFMIAGLIFMLRHQTKERKWRETGKWE